MPTSRRRKIPLKTNIFSLGFSKRIETALKERMVKTIADLIELTENQLLQTPNLGKKSVQEIKNFLEANGYTLRKN